MNIRYYSKRQIVMSFTINIEFIVVMMKKILSFIRINEVSYKFQIGVRQDSALALNVR